MDLDFFWTVLQEKTLSYNRRNTVVAVCRLANCFLEAAFFLNGSVVDCCIFDFVLTDHPEKFWCYLASMDLTFSFVHFKFLVSGASWLE